MIDFEKYKNILFEILEKNVGEFETLDQERSAGTVGTDKDAHEYFLVKIKAYDVNIVVSMFSSSFSPYSDTVRGAKQAFLLRDSDLKVATHGGLFKILQSFFGFDDWVMLESTLEDVDYPTSKFVMDHGHYITADTVDKVTKILKKVLDTQLK